ncbi:MAG: paraquat-inducible protein A [Hyphomicrobiales bacterium]
MMPVLLFTLVVSAGVAFYLGITEPLMVFERFFFFEKRASLIDIVRQLWIDQSWPLAIIVGFFSIIFPALKLTYLLVASLRPQMFVNVWGLSALSTLSKWSMMDVLVVALVIVATKTSGLAKATAQPGLWYFTACVVLMAIATLWVQRRAR